ncbi:hypothetical protein PO392_23795, partial [Klebsiella variicola]
ASHQCSIFSAYLILLICPVKNGGITDSLTQCWAVERAENAERIAELESRTVKLPKKNIGWDREEDDCWNNAIDACAEALAAAGIKVEAE